MSAHSADSEELFDDFVVTLRLCAERDGFKIHEVFGQAHLVRVEGPHRATVNIRTDAQNYGWWGFTKNVDTDLRNAGLKWFLVLLCAIPGEGYLLSDVEVFSAKTRWSDAGQQYHIHPHHLRESWKFRGVEQVWGRIKVRM
jgi:hypothetical protein